MKKSAGLLVYRFRDHPEFFLVHPGGPFWKNKQEGAWSIPKGEFSDEDALTAAKREFNEETGCSIEGEFLSLTPIRQKGGKMIFAFAVEGEIDEQNVVSNTFQMEWPYRSGKWMEVPEIDKAGWFGLEEARSLINPSQVALLEELITVLNFSNKNLDIPDR